MYNCKFNPICYYIYYFYLQKFGDFPILTTELNDADYAGNVEANKRQPRNEVARFILKDLDEAIARMKPRANAITNHRLNKESALLFKSRVALYEGTWETYHKGTARVPGGPGWPGGTFTGNLDTEIAFFLSEAMAAAKEVADAVELESAYETMFNQRDLASKKEVLLWRMYSAEAQVQSLTEGTFHAINEPDGCVGQGGGYTRSLVESFLMKNGLPIYASNSDYKGDKNTIDVTTDRDNRLVLSMSKPGDLIWRGKGMDKEMKMVYPNLVQGKYTLSPSATGYLIRKGWADSNVAVNDNSPMAYMIFRAAEAYLNYIEADYVKNGNLDANSQKYWKALRQRAGVDTDYQKTIAATDLSKEDDLAKYSGATMVDPTLYNIRRERRCEFIADGMRMWDLKRWRALDQVKNYVIEGFNLWGGGAAELYKDDKGESRLITTGDQANVSSQAASGNNLCPYRMTEKNNTMYNGYTWTPACYLYPIVFSDFMLSSPDGDVNNSPIYQNPGWPIEDGASALELPN